ncbi:MAG: GAF domain-containing protein, partial [Gemmatimonadetes bacterium]|nr:GAF domain-containing protein [Gemmatimonadota bacterium]
ALEVDESLEVLAERLRELFSFDVFVINTVDPDRGVVRDRRVAGRGATGIDWGVDEPLEGTLTGRAVRERAAFIAQASSAEEIARLYPESREELEGGACSFLTVPLMFSDAVVGTLQLRALELDAFSEEDLARAERVAGHVAGAVASAGLRDALVQEAAEREALAEIGRIVTSTLDVNAVYDEFAGQVRRVVRFDRLGVYLAEAEGGALTVRYAAGVDIPGMRPGSALSLGAGALDELFPGKLGRIFGPGQSYPLAGARVETAGGPARELPSAMTVPLLSGDRVIGVLELRSAEPGAYSERHLALAERIAALIAGAISNAHLHSRIQRESHERAVLAEIGRIVGSSPDIGDVYERFAEQVRALIPFDGVAVSTLDAAGQMVAGAYLAGVDVGGMAPGHSSPAAETVAGRAALSGKARLERVRDPGASELGAARGDSQIVIPLVSEGRAVGALTLAARGRDLYTEREVALAQQVAVQIAGAVARSQLHGELRLRGTALEAAADMILVTDRDGTIEYVNEAFARQTGYTKEEAVGRNPRMLKSDRQDPAYYKHLWDTILAGEVWQGTLTNRRKDGSEYPEEMTITPVRGEDGEIARFIAIKRDITERVRAEEERETLRKLDTENRELQRVNEARSRFVSTVSHELRTPLTSLLAFADILARNVAGNLQSRQIEQIEAIRRSGQRLQMLINDLLDVSRIDSGTFRLEETRFDARELLDEVVRSFGPILADRRQALKTSVPDRPLLVYADRERLSQVVSNLLSNASKYSPDDSVIDLEVRTHGSRLSVLVRDYGIGISAEDQQKLFTPFFRADNEATRSVPGTGLGLVIARSIVELH